jgi:hypothetical protein
MLDYLNRQRAFLTNQRGARYPLSTMSAALPDADPPPETLEQQANSSSQCAMPGGPGNRHRRHRRFAFTRSSRNARGP